MTVAEMMRTVRGMLWHRRDGKGVCCRQGVIEVWGVEEMGIIVEGGFYRNVFNAASLRDALLYMMIVTALRLTACTVLFSS